MKFVCERCGKKYATAEDPAPGRVYKLKCKACGNLIVVRAPAAGAGASSSGKPTRTTSMPAITPPPLPADLPGLSLEIGAPESAGNDPLAGLPGLPLNDSTTEISVSSFSTSLTGETPPPPMPPPGAPASGPGYVDLFADIGGPPPGEEKKDDPFLAAARASLPDSFGSGSSSKPDLFASMSTDRLPALGAEPSGRRSTPTTPKIPVIPKPHQQKSSVPIALIAGGVVVLVGILAFTVFGGGKKPSSTPAAAQAQHAARVETPATPAVQQPATPAVQQPATGAAPSAETGKAAKAEEERRSSEEQRKRQAEAAREREQQDRAAREEKDRIAREAKDRDREQRAARERDAKEARDRALAERATKDRDAKDARERDRADRAARDKDAREAKAREREERDRLAREAKAERLRKAAEAKAERERRAADAREAKAREAREAKAERERRVQEAAERDRQERERREGDKVASASGGEDAGGLTPAQMEKVLSSTKKAFDGCIQAAKGSDVKLDGRRVMLRLNIQTSGAVTYPTLDDVTLNGTDLGSCLKNAARLMVFPKFRGDTMHVEVPLVLASR